MLPGRVTRGVPPFWIVVFLAVALWGGELARRGLWEPDEARYAYVAREMRQDGHWFVPHINGEEYPDKPPLMFWLINLSSGLTGGVISGVSARLPSLLGSILSIWVATRLLARWHSHAAAWRVLFILPTSFLFWQEGGWGRIDALLCGLVMLSLYCFFTSLEAAQGRRELLAYVIAGLAMLAKGPVGLVVPMGVFLACLLTRPDRRQWRRSHWIWGPTVALSIPAAWLLVAWWQDASPGYFAALFGEKSFGRVLESKGHDRPFYYFLLHFPLEFLPWTLFLPAALASMTDAGLKRILLAWAIFVVVLFSLFVCKRHIYILPAYPAVAILIAAAWDDIQNLPRRWLTATGCAAMGFVWLLVAVGIATLIVEPLPMDRWLMVPSLLVLLSGGIALSRMYRRERLGARWFLIFCVCMLLFQVTVSAVILPSLNSWKGPVAAAKAVQACLPEDQPVYLYRQQLAIFSLYAERRGREIQSLEELKQMSQDGRHRVVVFLKRDWEEVDAQWTSHRVAHEFVMGGKKLVCVEMASSAGMAVWPRIGSDE